MPNTQNPRNGKAKKAPAEHSQTVIIPQISPEMLARARRAAEEGRSRQEIEAMEQEAAETAARQAAEQAKQPEPAPAQPKPAPKPGPRTRREAEAELFQTIHDDHLWLNNPVMVRGLGLAPIVVAAMDCDNAVMLCVAAILMLTATRMLAVAVCHLTANRFRPVIYCYAAAIIYVPAYILLYTLFGSTLSVLGIYLPLLVVEPAIIKRMESPELETVGEAFHRGINNTVGLCIAIMLVGILREFLGAGTFFGNPVVKSAWLPLASQPAGGFILVGVLCAVWTAIGGAYVHYKREEVRHLYADRKR